MEPAESVDAYLEDIPEPRRSQLMALRQVIHSTLPDARETLRYKMPTYEGANGMICAFANQKRYMSLYLCDTAAIERVRPHLTKADLGKGCIRFTNLDDLPRQVLFELLRGLARQA